MLNSILISFNLILLIILFNKLNKLIKSLIEKLDVPELCRNCKYPKDCKSNNKCRHFIQSK